MNRSNGTAIDPRHLWLAGLGSLVATRREAGRALAFARAQGGQRARQARRLAVDAGYIARGIAMTVQEKLQARLRG